MKRVIVLALALVFAGPAFAAKPAQLPAPKWYPGMVSEMWQAACHGYGGDYVNNNPSFAVAWSCVGIEWCEVRPETLGCHPDDR